jgi:hypothetical protein
MTDSRDLAHIESAPPPMRQSDNLLAQVIAAAKDPNVDANKMETLARLVNSQQDREREIEFNQSKNAAIMEMPVITKDGIITIPAKEGKPARTQGRFAKWEDIDRVVRPILAKHSLALSFDMAERQGGGITVTPILSHTNGYTQRGGAFPVPAEDSGSKNKAQSMGSSSSYGKRYAGCAMLNIVTEGVDNDGAGRSTAVNLPFEREQVVREDAELAIAEGRYLEWFATQSPKDRGWLVDQPFHVEHGGQPRIAAPEKRPEPRQRGQQRDPGPERDDPPPPADNGAGDPDTGGGGPPAKRTPAQMCEDFEKRIDEIGSSREVIDYQAEPKIAAWMGKLQDAAPDLYQRIVDHAAKRYSTLVAKEREAARSGTADGSLV